MGKTEEICKKYHQTIDLFRKYGSIILKVSPTVKWKL